MKNQCEGFRYFQFSTPCARSAASETQYQTFKSGGMLNRRSATDYILPPNVIQFRCRPTSAVQADTSIPQVSHQPEDSLMNEKAERILAEINEANRKGREKMWVHPLAYTTLNLLKAKGTITEDDLIKALEEKASKITIPEGMGEEFEALFNPKGTAELIKAVKEARELGIIDQVKL